jgi:beta-glucosidase
MAALNASCLPPHDSHVFCNTSLPESLRLDDLLKRLTDEELVGQLFMHSNMAYGNSTNWNSTRGDLWATGVPRLGIAEFHYLGQGSIYRGASNGCNVNCCTGGWAHGCIVDEPFPTVWPQGTGFAATFDPSLTFAAAVSISDESRAMHAHVPNRTVEYRTGASSVINIARDPRWGRVPETYGECPMLTSLIAVAFNKGLIGFSSPSPSARPPAVYKTLPVIRHLGAYAGPESSRFSFDALVTEPDLNLTYLPAWRALVREGALVGAMSAISALNGVPGIAHASLLTSTLRELWGFDGYVTSDCDTFPALLHTWNWAASPEQGAAAALLAGNDMNCGPGFESLYNATRLGYVDRADLLRAARRALTMRMRVGDLQPPSTDPWRRRADLKVVGSAANAALLERLVAAGTVLLHNKAGALPLLGDKRTIALIGPAADDLRIQAHTYHGTPKEWVTLRAALSAEVSATAMGDGEAPRQQRQREEGGVTPGHGVQVGTASAWAGESFASDDEESGLAGAGTKGGRRRVLFARGCAIQDKNTSGFAEALGIARLADAIVYAGGLDAAMVEEDTDRTDSPTQPNGLGLPGVQPKLLGELRKVASERGVPLIVLLVSGGPIAEPSLMVPSSPDAPDALLWTSYYGQSARPLARILLGLEMPSGRLPFTVPFNASSLPPMADYRMNARPGRTYRYLDEALAPPLYPFGHAGSVPSVGWSVSPIAPSSSTLTLRALRAAQTLPCIEGAGGVALSVKLTLSRGESGQGYASIANASRSLLLFGALDSNLAPGSIFPRKQLLAVAKPTVLPGAAASLRLDVCARDLLGEGLGADRMPMPNTLRLWIGDASHGDAQATVALDATESVPRDEL